MIQHPQKLSPLCFHPVIELHDFPGALNYLMDVNCVLKELSQSGVQWPVERLLVFVGSQKTYNLVCQIRELCWSLKQHPGHPVRNQSGIPWNVTGQNYGAQLHRLYCGGR